MTLGDKIYNLRKTANLSQEEFGSLFNVSRQSVSKWETNQVQPELKTIIDIAKYFNVSLDDLLLDKVVYKEKNSSFEDIYRMKMKFRFGCVVLVVGVLLLAVSMIVDWQAINHWGGLLKLFYRSIRYGDFLITLYYFILFAIMGLGLYIIKESFDKK